MSFCEILSRAQGGEGFSVEIIVGMYRPLLLKESIVCSLFDEDLYQELCLTLLNCIRHIKI